jgi:hypothetical protein
VDQIPTLVMVAVASLEVEAGSEALIIVVGLPEVVEG